MVGPSQYNTRGKDSWSLSLHSGSHQQTAYESLPNYSCRNVLQTTLFSVRHLLFLFVDGTGAQTSGHLFFLVFSL